MNINITWKGMPVEVEGNFSRAEPIPYGGMSHLTTPPDPAIIEIEKAWFVNGAGKNIQFSKEMLATLKDDMDVDEAIIDELKSEREDMSDDDYADKV